MATNIANLDVKFDEIADYVLGAREFSVTMNMEFAKEGISYLKQWNDLNVRRQVKIIVNENYIWPWSIRKGKAANLVIKVADSYVVTVVGEIIYRRKNELLIEGYTIWRGHDLGKSTGL